MGLSEGAVVVGQKLKDEYGDQSKDKRSYTAESTVLVTELHNVMLQWDNSTPGKPFPVSDFLYV